MRLSICPGPAAALSWQLETVGSGWEALERVQCRPRPGHGPARSGPGDSDGLHTLRWLRRVRPDLPVLVLANSDDPNQKLEAIRLGAQDFLLRPLQAPQLETAIRRSLFSPWNSGESEIA